MQNTCSISGERFTVSDHEMALRKTFGFGDSLPSIKPKYRFRHLGAFWPQWAFHKRDCDKTGETIISIFREDCPYPVWKRSEWIAHATPPSQDIDFQRPFFEQAWDLFQRCPLPHNLQNKNQNCEYTDDWYHSKNCYLCHSGDACEDCRYCYGCVGLKDVYGAVFSHQSERCADLINCTSCFNSVYLLNCKNVYDSAFLYDCRDCSDCLFSSNLRNKQYVFANEQLTKEEYEKKKVEWDFSSRCVYEAAKEHFTRMMHEQAWHRALQIDKCENSTGNFIATSKDCENCYMLTGHENAANVAFCGPEAKTILDSLGTIGSELNYMCSLPVYSYGAQFCFSVVNCRFVQYSAYLQNCEYCFGCCGLMGKKYHIFNKPYSKEEYEALVPQLIAHMQSTGEWGQFFPGHFAPNPYEESLSAFHFPLEGDAGFRRAAPLDRRALSTAPVTEIPDSAAAMTPEQEVWLQQQVFFDEAYGRPFQVQAADIAFARMMKVPLPNAYYMHRIQDNFRWMPFAGELRETHCAKSGEAILTNWPAEMDSRILSEAEYLAFIR